MHQVSSLCPWESFTASCYMEMQVLKPNWGRKRAGKLPEGWECSVAPARHLLVGTEGSQLSSVGKGKVKATHVSWEPVESYRNLRCKDRRYLPPTSRILVLSPFQGEEPVLLTLLASTLGERVHCLL